MIISHRLVMISTLRDMIDKLKIDLLEMGMSPGDPLACAEFAMQRSVLERLQLILQEQEDQLNAALAGRYP